MITAKPRSSPPASRMKNASPPRVRTVDLRGPAGRLEAVLNEGSPHAAFAAVVAHPHPLGGGSLHNKVVYHAMKVMNAPDWASDPTGESSSEGHPTFEFPVLRFNFRGTGMSEGIYDGEAEADDVAAALTWIENEYKLPVVAAGFSFGAAKTLRACCGNDSVESPWNVRALVAIGLPMRSGAGPVTLPSYDYSFLKNCRTPKLFLSGDADQFATPTELIAAAATAAEPKTVALVPGADHFFRGHLQRMQMTLAGWLKEQVYDPGQRSGI